MLILLDCRPLFAEGLDSERTRFIFSTVAALSRDKAVKWLFLADRSYQPPLIPDLAGSSVLVHRAFPGRMGWRLWYDRLIPRLARKHKVDWIMLTGGVAAGRKVIGAGVAGGGVVGPGIAGGGVIGPGTIPQCLWMPERANPAEGKGYLPLYAARLRESLSRAALLFCFSAADRSWLGGQVLGMDPARFEIVSAWPSEVIAPLTTSEKEAIKQQFAAGKEYFLADVNPTDEEGITQLLKSFSLFKKRQLSNLQLVLAGRKPLPESKFNRLLEAYKYRQDIHWCESGDMEKRLTGAAYALLLPFETKTVGIPLLNAWKAEVPVIIEKNSGLRDMAGEGVLVADKGDPTSLAGHLMAVYKDEEMRKDLIAKGRQRAAGYSAQQTVARVAAGLGLE
jgi:glycosyltransferase involved in cell wall biosynthesis